VLTSSEDAHVKSMSTFETDEHLRVIDAGTLQSGRGGPKGYTTSFSKRRMPQDMSIFGR
jgi:hypothetical protein